MNKSELVSLLVNKIIKLDGPENQKINDVQWKFQDCKDGDILFFKTPQNMNEELVNNVNNCEASIVFVDNPEIYEKIKHPKILVSKNEWLTVQKIALDQFYPMPMDIKIVGVTGTNGKSTVVNFIEQILKIKKEKVVSCGTLGLFVNGEKETDFSLTTPSYIDIRKLLSKYKKFPNFIFEVSSHSLSQERFFELEFDQIGWTSFSQDHLDYHETMEEYFKEKLKIINYSKNKLFLPERSESLIELFDEVDHRLAKKIDDYPNNNVFSADFNKANFELALTLSEKLLDKRLSINLNQIQGVPGRFQLIPWEDNFFVVDYAHTPDALINICKEIKENYKDYQLISVFGCGGDRDRSKRPLMAKAVEIHSDKVVLTSDNPRFEDPLQILSDAQKGFKSIKKHVIQVDRVKAIEAAMSGLEEKTIILVAGKGHENYLDVKGVKHDYSDEETILKLIENYNA